MCLEYRFQVFPIIISAMGYALKFLINYRKMIRFKENESKVLISKLETKFILEIVKIWKMLLNLNNLFNDFNFN